MIREIPPLESNEKLSQKTIPFDFENPQVDLKELYVDLVETMKENKGLGIAANQIGVPYSIFVIESVIPIMIINPEIVSQNEEDFATLAEGCLSSPGLFVSIKRPKTVELKYFDINGKQETETFTGLSARVVFHEMEHLNGKKFYHSASRYHINKALKAAYKKSAS